MADKFAVIPLPVSVSINGTQQQQYKAFFSDEQLITDTLSIGGPLNGLLSIHSQYPDDDLLLLACDMINMQTETLIRLINAYADEPGYDFYVYQNVDFAEPLCAIYTSCGLAKHLQNQEPFSQRSNSLQKVLNQGMTKRLTIAEPESFKNKNTL
jgi:molybdopterin-guanine dinucleotide biosynthesis protein A